MSANSSVEATQTITSFILGNSGFLKILLPAFFSIAAPILLFWMGKKRTLADIEILNNMGKNLSPVAKQKLTRRINRTIEHPVQEDPTFLVTAFMVSGVLFLLLSYALGFFAESAMQRFLQILFAVYFVVFLALGLMVMIIHIVMTIQKWCSRHKEDSGDASGRKVDSGDVFDEG